MHEPRQKQLRKLAAYLASGRERLLGTWRATVTGDPELTASRQHRAALDDHVPAILADFERRLRAEDSMETVRVELDARKNAAEHARQRWERGYDLRQAVKEWGHLQLVVIEELDRYAEAHAEVAAATMALARRIFIALTAQGISESATKYERLLRAEADNRETELQQSLNTLQTLENERAALLRQAAHDLRGKVGVISNVSSVLRTSKISEGERQNFYAMLQRGIGSMAALLGEMLQLARLESGRDRLRLEQFDAAETIRHLCGLMRPTADERKLFLKCSGPARLEVEGDPSKLQRILQNLVMNSIKATDDGGVEIGWQLLAQQRWQLVVKDSGRGFDVASTVTPNITQRTDAGEAETGPASSGALPASEGIGLSIVKRLCSLLEAEVEIDSVPGQGTVIRTTFPTRYSGLSDAGCTP